MTSVDHSSLGDLWLPLSDGTEAQTDMAVTPDLLDLHRLAGDQQARGPLAIQGDLFQSVTPYARVPWVEAILGADIQATIKGGSMRAQSSFSSFEDWEQRDTLLGREWMSLLVRLTELLVERNGEGRAVVHTLMRGPSDIAEAILGPELMSLAMYDRPEDLTRFLNDVTTVFVDILNQQQSRIRPTNDGYVNPFGIWAPGKVVRTQCDATAFLSPEHYKKWYLPYDIRICRAVDYSIIHLHSCSLHTADVILENELPNAVQITLEDESSAPPIIDLLPTFRKILEQKPLVLDGPLTNDQTDMLCCELPNDGLCIIARKSGS